MVFNFELTPLESIAPWGEAGAESLSWFGLTDGRYWLKVGGDELLRYSDQAQVKYGAPRYCDYNVVRLYEDLMEILPHVMEPLPALLVPYLCGESSRKWERLSSHWFENNDDRLEDERFWEKADMSAVWVGNRTLDTGYLSPSANIRMWSDLQLVTIQWDNVGKEIQGIPAWSATKGSWSLPRDLFVSEVRSFHARLMHAMEERVRQVLDGALHKSIAIDLQALVDEHERRSRSVELALASPSVPTDWEGVFAAILEIEGEMKGGHT